MKPTECKCDGRFHIKCNSDYCTSNEQACDQLKRVENLITVKKCQQNSKYFLFIF